MNIVEQLNAEVSEQAGSYEGFLSLVKLLLREIDKVDVTSPKASSQYAMMLRAYVLVKRQMEFFSRHVEVDRFQYDNIMKHFKYTIRMKREAARKHASQIPPDRLKAIQKEIGTHLNIRSSERVQIPPEVRHLFVQGDPASKGRSYNKL